MTYISYEEHYAGTDWEQSSGPILSRKVHLDDLWPTVDSAAVAKDPIVNGLHPVMAIGNPTTLDGRPEQATGVVMTYNDKTEIAVLNVADKVIVRDYVSNILTYDPGQAAATFETAPAIGQPVYVDDSSDLGAGCTLSLSPLNDESPGLPNPLAGWLFYCQDEYQDSGIGGPNVDATWPKTWVEGEYLVCVMLTNATGQAWYDALALRVAALE